MFCYIVIHYVYTGVIVVEKYIHNPLNLLTVWYKNCLYTAYKCSIGWLKVKCYLNALYVLSKCWRYFLHLFVLAKAAARIQIFSFVFEFTHSLDTTHDGCPPLHVVILFTNGKKGDHKNISCFHIYTFKCISMNYVDRTNLKYRWGNCIIVANLEIFDTRQDLWTLQRTNFTQTRL